MKTTMTVAQAKESLEQWWFTTWQKYVDIIADEEDGFIRIRPKKGENTIYGLADLGQWLKYHDFGSWVSFNTYEKTVEIVISIA